MAEFKVYPEHSPDQAITIEDYNARAAARSWAEAHLQSDDEERVVVESTTGELRMFDVYSETSIDYYASPVEEQEP